MPYSDVIHSIDAKLRAKLGVFSNLLLGKFRDILETKTHVGLDIGNYSVKCAEVFYDYNKGNKPDNKPKLLKLGYAEFGNEAALQGKAEAIRSAFKVAGIENKFVNIAVGGDGVVVRNIRVPRMTKDELGNALKFEADKYIPFSVDEVILDFYILPEPVIDGRMHVVLAAAKKTVIEAQLDLLKQAGYECGLVDINSFAAVNAFTANNSSLDNTAPLALLDVGAGNTNLNILVKNMPHFTRDILIGGDDFTCAIAEACGINKSQAEELKSDIPAARMDKVSEAIAPVFDDLCEELQRCFDYFENQSVYPIKSIFVTGGASGFQHLLEHLKKTFKVDVLKWDPLETIEKDEGLNLEQFANMKNLFATSIGLGLRR